MDVLGHGGVGAAVAHGKPVIRGTRVPLTVVVGSLAGGMTFEEVRREYDVTADDIRAALRFVAELGEYGRSSLQPVSNRSTTTFYA
jgi:uncharacterized protein (DUF433 family)